MIRMTRLTDYGIMLLTYFARDPSRPHRTARELAIESRLPQPTVSKILKALAHKGLLTTHRGVKGGFALARTPQAIDVAEIITALEGPPTLTQCSGHRADQCGLESLCPVGGHMKRINLAVLEALKKTSLAELAHSAPTPVVFRTPAAPEGKIYD